MGPFDEKKLSRVPGITDDTMICPEYTPEGEKQKWQPVSNLESFSAQQKEPSQTVEETPVSQGAEDQLREQSPWHDPESAMGEKSSSDDIDKLKSSGIAEAAFAAESISKGEQKEDIPLVDKPFEMPKETKPADLEIPSEKSAGETFQNDKAAVNKGFDAHFKPISLEGDLPSSQHVEDKIKNLESSVAKLTNIVETISEKLSFQQNSVNEIKSAVTEVFKKEDIEQVQQQSKAEEYSDTETYQSIQNALEKPQETSKQEEQPEQQPEVEEEVEEEYIAPTMEKPAGRKTEQTQVMIGGKAKPSLLARLFKAFFVIVFILVLTSVTFVFLSKKGILPEFLNPLNYVLSTTTQTEAQPVANEVVAPYPVSAETAEDTESKETLMEVKEFKLKSGLPLSDVITDANKDVNGLSFDWSIQKIDEDIFSVIVKIPPVAQRNWVVSYRFDYNKSTQALIPTNSEAQNLFNM